MRLFPQSFRVSVVLVTALATLIAAAAIGFTYHTIHRQRSESDLGRLLRLSASDSAAHVSRWLEDRRNVVATIADSVTLVEELRRIRQLTPQDDEYFLSLYRLKKELDQNTLSHSFIHEITIHAPDTGTILLASTGEDVDVASAEDDDRGVSEARNQLWVSPIFPAEIPLPDETRTSATAVPCLFIAAPIRDGADLYGVLRVRAGALDIGDNLLRAAKYSDMFGTSDVLVVNSEGILLSPSHFEQELKAAGRIRNRSMLELMLHVPSRDEFTSAFSQSRVLLQAETTGRSTELSGYVDLQGYEGIRGRKVVGSWARVKGTDWVCIAEIDHEEAFAPLHQLTRTTLYLSLGIGVLVVGLTIWLATRIVAPLKNLADVAAQLASGDRSVRCGMVRDDEIGSLAAAFDNMADSVEETLTDLEQNADRLAQSNRQLASELTERQRVEEELRSANSFLDSVIDNIPTMLFMKDANDLRIVRFNKAGLELLGVRKEEIIGKTDFDLYPKEEAEFFTHKDRDVLNTLEMIEIEEEELLTRGGLRILHTKKIPVCDEDGKPQMLLGISEDITEKKQTLEALKAAKESAESANHAKSDFLANMSHEIRTPMNAIIGLTDLVLDTELEPTQRDYLTIVTESADSLLSIINEILDFSKIEAGKLELEAVEFDVREEVGDMLKSLGLRAHAKNLELAWQVHSDVPIRLIGDRIRLRQMLVNLVGNAIKFTQQGEVFVNVASETSQESQITLHVSVRDTGIGIREEKRARIFSAFEQADMSITREFGGTGLGLAITSSLAQAMGGRVWVESVPGQGSTFHFTGNFGRGAEQVAEEEFPDLSGLPVLVVDDNATNRRILSEMLTRWGMSAETVEGGPQAISALEHALAGKGPLPLVISDVHMPFMDGFTLTEQLRSTTLLRDTIVIMLTSGGRAGDMKRCEQLGVGAHLMKPVKQSELLNAIVVAVRGQAPRADSQSDVTVDADAIPPLRILLAEDGKANQIMAVGLLTKWGHTVEVAENGEQAVTLWQSGSFDVILMDVQMPVLDGLEATRRIRELEVESRQRVPIVAMTARAMKGDRERCLAAGMDDYVSKPVRKPELYRALKSLTENSPDNAVHSGHDSSETGNRKVENNSATNIIDWNAALKNAGGDHELLGELLKISLQENQTLMQRLSDAVSAQQAEEAGRYAHTIKGEAQTIAANGTAQAAAAIEASVAQGDFDSVRRHMPRLREAIEQLTNAILQQDLDGGSGIP